MGEWMGGWMGGVERVSGTSVSSNAPTARPAFTLVCQQIVIAPPAGEPVPADGPGLIWLGGGEGGWRSRRS